MVAKEVTCNFSSLLEAAMPVLVSGWAEEMIANP